MENKKYVPVVAKSFQFGKTPLPITELKKSNVLTEIGFALYEKFDSEVLNQDIVGCVFYNKVFNSVRYYIESIYG